jgi:hypothetical protein
VQGGLFVVTIISNRLSCILIAISGRRTQGRRRKRDAFTVCICVTVGRLDTSALHLAEHESTENHAHKAATGRCDKYSSKSKNLSLHNSISTHPLGAHVTQDSRPRPAAATGRYRIDDVLIPEQIQKPSNSQLVTEFPALGVTQMLITVFTTAHN